MNLVWKSRAPRTQMKRQDVHCLGESQNQRAKREAENMQNQPTVGSEECGPRAWGAGGMAEQEGLRTAGRAGKAGSTSTLMRGGYTAQTTIRLTQWHTSPLRVLRHVNNTSKQDGPAFPGQRSTPSVLGAPASGTGTGPGG